MRRRYMHKISSPSVSTITIDQNLTDPYSMVSGDINGEVIQWIRQNSHIYLCKFSDGKMYICQLNDSNSNYYYDGTDAVLTGSEGDVMMKLPTFFTKAEEVSSDVWNISFSDKNVDGTWMEWGTNDLIGVYEAYSYTNSKLYSRSGVSSSGSTILSFIKTYARNRGDGFTLVKWKHQNIMAFLYYAMYGNTNCQATIGYGTDSYTKKTGQTNSLGMTDTVAGGNGDSNSIKFWGLENWWGNKYEWVDNAVIDPESLDGLWRITEDDGGTRDVQGIKMAGYPTKFVIGSYLDLIPKEAGGSYTTGYCDNVYTNSSYNSSAINRSGYSDSIYGGVAFANAYPQIGETGLANGSRLAYHGDMEEIKDVTEFKSIAI